MTVTQTNYKLRQLKDNSVAECIRMGRTGYCTTFFCDLQFPACQSALMHSIHDVTVIPRGMHGDSQHFEYEQPFPLKMFQPPTFTHTNSRWTRWRASWQSFRTENPFGSNILLATGSNHLLAIIGLATGSLSARLLGVDGKGELAAIQNLYWLGGILVMMGLEEAGLYFSARAPQEAGRYLGTATLLSLLATPFWLAFLLPLVPLFLSAQSQNLIGITKWILMGIPLYALVMIPVFMLRGLQHMFIWNLMRLLPSLGWLLLIIYAWFTSRHAPAFLAAGYLLILALLLVPLGYFVRRLIPKPYGPQLGLFLPMLKYGMPLALADLKRNLNLKLDQLIMPMFLASYSLGLYVVAVAWSGAIYPMLHGIGNVLCPRIAAEQYSRDLQIRSATQGVRLSMITGVLLTSAALLLTPFVIPFLFGVAFAPAVPVALVLLCAGLIQGLNFVMEECLRGLGNASPIFWAEAVGLVITVISLIQFLPTLGIMGASIASVLGYGFTFLHLVNALSQLTHLRAAEFLIPRKNDWHLISSGLHSLLKYVSTAQR